MSKHSVLKYGWLTVERGWSADGSLDDAQDGFKLLSYIIRDPHLADYPRTLYLADIVDDDQWIWEYCISWAGN